MEQEDDLEIDRTITSESVIEKVKSENCDTFVADFSPPEMDGIELLKIIRQGAWHSIRDALLRKQSRDRPQRSVVGIPSQSFLSQFQILSVVQVPEAL